MHSIDINPMGVRKILVCQLRQIGDVILATPSIHLLKERFPKAGIYLLTEKKCAEMVKGHPDLAGVFAVDKKEQKGLLQSLRFSKMVASQRFDVIIDFQQLPRCRFVVGLSRLYGTNIRLSYTPPWYNRWLYSNWAEPRGGYAAMTKASILEPLGVVWRGDPPSLSLTEEDEKRAAELLLGWGVGDNHFLVTVDPTHRRETRCWPARHYAETLKAAVGQRPDLRFLLLYGPGEDYVAQDVARMAGTSACIVPENVPTLREMAALIKRADLHFGNCSAPRHVAVAVGTPSLTILGSTSQAWTFPGEEHTDLSLGLDCQPCNENTCPMIRCMQELTPNMVLPVLMRRIEKIRGEAVA